MTSAQERKLDDLHNLAYEIAGDMKAYKVHQDNQTEAILENVRDILAINKTLELYKADRNKAVGIAWLGGIIGGLGGLGAFVLSFFKH